MKLSLFFKKQFWKTVSNTFKVWFSYFAVPQFETSCSYVEATLEEFLTWNCDHSSISGPFIDYDYSKFWAYADYKYVVSLFEDKTDIFQVSQHIPFNHDINLFLRKDHKLEIPWSHFPHCHFLSKEVHCGC